MAYATVEDVQARMTRQMSESEQAICSTMLDDAAVMIDVFNAAASDDAKKVVSCRVVIRELGDGDSSGVPIFAALSVMSNMAVFAASIAFAVSPPYACFSAAPNDTACSE